jgi:hypothetical protein
LPRRSEAKAGFAGCLKIKSGKAWQRGERLALVRIHEAEKASR